MCLKNDRLYDSLPHVSKDNYQKAVGFMSFGTAGRVFTM